MKKKKWGLKRTAYVVMGVFFLTILIGLVTSHGNIGEKYPKHIELTENWTLDNVEGQPKTSLPHSFPSKEGVAYSISHTFTEEEAKNPGVLYISLYYCDLNVYIDGQLYESYAFEKTTTHKTEGMVYQFFDMPLDMQGRVVTLEYIPQLNIDTVRITAPAFGYKMDIFASLADGKIWDIELIFIIFILGAGLLCASLWSRILMGKGNVSMIALGLFSTNAGLYLGVQLECLRAYFQSPMWFYQAEFLSQLLIMIPMLLLLRNVLYGSSRAIMDTLLIINMLEVSVQYILYFTTEMELREMLTASHICLAISIIAGIYCIFVRKEIEPGYRKELIYAAIPIGGAGLIEAIMHYFVEGIHTGVVFKVGFIVFMIIEIFYTTKRFRDHLLEEEKNQIFKKVAYTDMATGIKNRNAYEKACEEIEINRAQYESVAGIVFDLNNLKMINDTKGHAEGDALIKGMADILSNVFETAYGVYRTGGDEFIVLLTDITQLELDEFMKKLDEAGNVYAAEGRILDYSCGSAMYLRERHKYIADMIKDADNKMYENKRRYHKVEAEKIKSLEE